MNRLVALKVPASLKVADHPRNRPTRLARCMRFAPAGLRSRTRRENDSHHTRQGGLPREV